MMSLLPILWIGSGLLGVLLFAAKVPESPSRTCAESLLLIPFAVVFGPLILLQAIAATPKQKCPHCRAMIPADATVCARCTREISMQNWDG